ncbi:hypothetical protein Hanom_Chr03g00179661 [Helianthus anomalus]
MRSIRILSKKTIKKPEPIRTEPRLFYDYHHEALMLRSSPSAFIDTVRKFTAARIADVKSIDFGSLLDMKVNYISTHLGFWLLRNYDEQFNILNIGNHKIPITRDLVYEINQVNEPN